MRVIDNLKPSETETQRKQVYLEMDIDNCLSFLMQNTRSNSSTRYYRHPARCDRFTAPSNQWHTADISVRTNLQSAWESKKLYLYYIIRNES